MCLYARRVGRFLGRFCRENCEQGRRCRRLDGFIAGQGTHGQTLRLALILEYLWWCPTDGAEPSGMRNCPLCDKADGDLLPADVWQGPRGCRSDDRGTQRTIVGKLARAKETEVGQRDGNPGHRQLPGLRNWDSVKAACRYLEEAGWLIHRTTGQPGRPRGDFQVNPRLWPQLSSNTE